MSAFNSVETRMHFKNHDGFPHTEDRAPYESWINEACRTRYANKINTSSIKFDFYHASNLNKYTESSDYGQKPGVKLDALPHDLTAEIRSSMTDWELYMRCKENEARSDSIPCEFLPSIRDCHTVRFSFDKHSSNFTFPYPKIEIRARDENEEISEKEERDKRLIQAKAEKVRGNSAFKLNDFRKACEHYSNSIALVPIKESYNNRAQANMKLNNFSSALPDLNEVLRQDPENIKALYRRAKCKRVLHMYNEALKDLSTVVKLEPSNKEAPQMMNEIKSIIENLKGKKYRIRANFGDKETFEVDVSQLPVYASCDDSYILEVDRAGGCMKSCVCGFCVHEDRFARPKSTCLRIKERDRWRQLTPALLNEMRLLSTVDKAVSKDLKEIANAECSNKIKLANGDTEVKGIENSFSEINLRNGPSKKANISNYHRENSESLRNVQPSSLKQKFNTTLNDKILTALLRSVCDEFDVETESELILEYLRNVAMLETFKVNFELVEEEMRKDVRALLSKAVKLNFNDSSELEKLYS